MNARVAVLASGEGTNLQALLDHSVVGPWIVLVVSDITSSGALRRARARGVEAVFLDPSEHPSRSSYGAALVGILRDRDVGGSGRDDEHFFSLPLPGRP